MIKEYILLKVIKNFKQLLIISSTGDPTETEMDSILILTRDSYYIADYDDQIDKVTNYQRVLLSDIVLIECGQPENTVSLFKNKNHYCIRINYKVNGDCGYFHMFRSTNLRFFNNMAIVIKTEEESIGIFFIMFK